MSRPECRDRSGAGLDELDVDLARTDYFHHASHATTSAGDGSRRGDVVARLFQRCRRRFQSRGRGQRGFLAFLGAQALRSGFPGPKLEQAMKQHPGFKYSPPEYPAFTNCREAPSCGSATMRSGAFTLRPHAGHLASIRGEREGRDERRTIGRSRNVRAREER